MITVKILENGEVTESYDDPISYDAKAKVITLPAGQGTMSVQFGENTVMQVEVDGVIQVTAEEEAVDMQEALGIMGVQIDD